MNRGQPGNVDAEGSRERLSTDDTGIHPHDGMRTELSAADPSIPSTRAPSGWPTLNSTRWLLAVSLVLIAGGMGLRIWLYREPVNSDDVNYLWMSRDFFGEAGALPSFRFVLLLIPRLTVAIFGYSLAAFYSAVYLHALIAAIGIAVFVALFAGARATVLVLALWSVSVVFIEADTRLLPDNLGIGLALLGVSAVAYGIRLRGLRRVAQSDRWASAATFAGALLAWAAFSTRETFAPMLLVTAMVVVLARPPRRLLFIALAGLASGLAIEFAWTWSAAGDPYARMHDIVSRSTPAVSGNASQGGVYSGYTWERMVTRYPDLLKIAGGFEYPLLVGGGLGMTVWVARIRRPTELVKLACVFATFVVLTIGVSNLDPPKPFMREKLRYYATAAPFFYLAAAELALVTGSVTRRGMKRLLTRRFRVPAWTGAIGVTGAALLIVATSVGVVIDRPHAVRNGDDRLFQVASIIRSHSDETSWPQTVQSDARTNRVWNLTFPEAAGWDVRSIEDDSPLATGYLVLDWTRLNYNVSRGYDHADMAHQFNETIDQYPVVMDGMSSIDVYAITEEPIRRQEFELTKRVDGWTIDGDDGRSFHPSGTREAFTLAPGDRLYSGAGRPGQHTDSGGVQNHRFVAFSAEVTSSVRASVDVQLRWHDRAGEPHNQDMRRVAIPDGKTEIATWTYITGPATDFRVLVRSRSTAPLKVANLKVRALVPHALDVVDAEAAP